ncbi:MAG TPA: L,D-transpeptidase, partial [Phototrophicaceae bacterium]|nr:L,D-transpeptidase [Phototrophicaceae bacterium]
MRWSVSYTLITVFILILWLSVGQTRAEDIPTCSAETDCATSAWGISADVIAAYPRPNVTQTYADNSQLYDRIYRRVNGAIDLYDAPNGNIKGNLGSGFNFVTLSSQQDGWAQITSDTWVKTDNLTDNVIVSSFAGIKLPEETLPYPVAWLLVNLEPAEYPGGEPSDNNELMLRYTTVNLYSTVDVDGWHWYQIGVNRWVKQTQVARVLPVTRSADIDTERWISVDLYEQVLIAYEGTQPIFATLISSGLPDWETEEGLFHVYVRYQRTIMSGAEGQKDFYYLEEVPDTMYFNGDTAI